MTVSNALPSQRPTQSQKEKPQPKRETTARIPSIEYWGYFGKDYMKRKEEKIKLYRKGKVNLISIEDIMLVDIYSNLEKELAKSIKIDKFSQEKKHCPNCGIELDKRF